MKNIRYNIKLKLKLRKIRTKKKFFYSYIEYKLYLTFRIGKYFLIMNSLNGFHKVKFYVFYAFSKLYMTLKNSFQPPLLNFDFKFITKYK